MRPQEYNQNVTFVPKEPTYAENVTNTYNQLVKLAGNENAQKVINEVRTAENDLVPEDFFADAAVRLKNASSEQVEGILEQLYKEHTSANRIKFEMYKGIVEKGREVNISTLDYLLSMNELTQAQYDSLVDQIQTKKFEMYKGIIEQGREVTISVLDYLLSMNQLSKEQYDSLIKMSNG